MQSTAKMSAEERIKVVRFSKYSATIIYERCGHFGQDDGRPWFNNCENLYPRVVRGLLRSLYSFWSWHGYIQEPRAALLVSSMHCEEETCGNSAKVGARVTTGRIKRF